MKETVDDEADTFFSGLETKMPRQKDDLTQSEHTGELNKSFRPGTFLRDVEADIRRRYGDASPKLSTHLRTRLVQFWFGADRAIHYEVWIHERLAQIEIGLHFESRVRRNRELYRRFDGELLSIQAVLGDSIWLEEWERGWSRIYETQLLWPLDSARVITTSDRLAEMIATFQPILDG
ncbi:MAG: hypothetical protein ABIO92_04360 [Chloroflexia bacterium]